MQQVTMMMDRVCQLMMMTKVVVAAVVVVTSVAVVPAKAAVPIGIAAAVGIETVAMIVVGVLMRMIVMKLVVDSDYSSSQQQLLAVAVEFETQLLALALLLLKPHHVDSDSVDSDSDMLIIELILVYFVLSRIHSLFPIALIDPLIQQPVALMIQLLFFFVSYVLLQMHDSLIIVFVSSSYLISFYHFYY